MATRTRSNVGKTLGMRSSIEVKGNNLDVGILQHVEQTDHWNQNDKKAEYMQTLPTENAGGRKNCVADEVGLSIILLCDTQLQQKVDFVLNSFNVHTC